MKKITIDCTGLSNGAELHDLLAKNLDFPGYYGKNLDALYDCMTEISEETLITVLGLDTLDFAEGFRNTLLDAERDNFWLHIAIE